MAEGQIGFLKKQWKQDGLLSLAARLVLGAVFIYASMDKILHPAAFVKAVYNFQVFPDFLINLTAIFLPWLGMS